MLPTSSAGRSLIGLNWRACLRQRSSNHMSRTSPVLAISPSDRRLSSSSQPCSEPSFRPKPDPNLSLIRRLPHRHFLRPSHLPPRPSLHRCLHHAPVAITPASQRANTRTRMGAHRVLLTLIHTLMGYSRRVASCCWSASCLVGGQSVAGLISVTTVSFQFIPASSLRPEDSNVAKRLTHSSQQHSLQYQSRQPTPDTLYNNKERSGPRFGRATNAQWDGVVYVFASCR